MSIVDMIVSFITSHGCYRFTTMILVIKKKFIYDRAYRFAYSVLSYWYDYFLGLIFLTLQNNGALFWLLLLHGLIHHLSCFLLLYHTKCENIAPVERGVLHVVIYDERMVIQDHLYASKHRKIRIYIHKIWMQLKWPWANTSVVALNELLSTQNANRSSNKFYGSSTSTLF
jgi:hypothetical protein